jgi:hypothetical protein
LAKDRVCAWAWDSFTGVQFALAEEEGEEVEEEEAGAE